MRVEGATQGVWWSQRNKKDTVGWGGNGEVGLSRWGSVSLSGQPSLWWSLCSGLSPGPLSPFLGAALHILGSPRKAAALMSPVSQLFIFMAGPPPDKEAIAAEVCRHRNSHR